MTKNVSALTHVLRDQGAGVFRTGAVAPVGTRPYVIVTDANPNKAALLAAYPGSSMQQRVQERAAGATWFEYPEWNMAKNQMERYSPAIYVCDALPTRCNILRKRLKSKWCSNKLGYGSSLADK